MSDAIKLCKDCQFCEPYPAADLATRFQLAKCGRSVLIPDLVTGIERRRFCETERAMNTADACGPTGLFFVQDDCDVVL